jgi:urease accessory protein
MATSASGLEYGAGFVLATVLLHGAGIASGLALGSLGERKGQRIAHAAGAMMVSIGVGILFSLI